MLIIAFSDTFLTCIFFIFEKIMLVISYFGLLTEISETFASLLLVSILQNSVVLNTSIIHDIHSSSPKTSNPTINFLNNFTKIFSF